MQMKKSVGAITAIHQAAGGAPIVSARLPAKRKRIAVPMVPMAESSPNAVQKTRFFCAAPSSAFARATRIDSATGIPAVESI